MKLTRHNGRAGKNGTYNPKHNDRRFDVEHSEHINPEMTKKNVYWDCYTGIKSVAFRENPDAKDFSFEEIEKLYYVEHYGRQRGWERIPSCNELPDNKDGFVELTEEEVRQLELPKEWIA